MPSSLNRRQLLATLGIGIAALSGCTDSTDDSEDERTTQTETPPPTETPSPTPELVENEYRFITIFRNSDAAPWSEIGELRSVGEIFERHRVPLTNCPIPYDPKKDERLDSRTDLCEYLAGDEERLFENALHGYTHARDSDFYWGSEFGGLPYEEQKDKITRGVEIFESCFGTSPTVFVPPYNTYDETTVRVLVEEGFDVVSSGSFFQQEHFGKDGLWHDGEILHLPANLAVEDSDTEEVRPIDDLRQEYDQNEETYGLNVVMFHYYFYTEESDFQTLDDIVQYAIKDDTRLMTIGEFAHKLEHEELSRTEDGWRVLERAR